MLSKRRVLSSPTSMRVSCSPMVPGVGGHRAGGVDDLDTHVKQRLSPEVHQAKARLLQEIDRERSWETKQDRSRDERFE